MGVLANSALEKGTYVTGVITERLRAKGQVNSNLSMLESYTTMQSRKARMIELADAFIMTFCISCSFFMTFGHNLPNE